MKPTQKSFRRSLLTVVIIVAAIVIYAYGFQVTQVNLEETAKPQRQQQLVRIIRALAQPDLLTYQQEVTKAQAPVLIFLPLTASASRPIRSVLSTQKRKRRRK